MKLLPLLMLILALASCTAPTPPPPKAIPAPRQSADVSPLVAAAREDAVKAGTVSAKLEGQVEGLKATSGHLADGLGAAIAELDKLRFAKAATETELESLWAMLTASNTQARNLFAEVEKAKATADEQKVARLGAERAIDSLLKAAAEADREKLELRDQREHYAAELAKAGIVHADLLEKLSIADKKAAVGTYLKGIAAFVILILAAVVALKVFKPF